MNLRFHQAICAGRAEALEQINELLNRFPTDALVALIPVFARYAEAFRQIRPAAPESRHPDRYAHRGLPAPPAT